MQPKVAESRGQSLAESFRRVVSFLLSGTRRGLVIRADLVFLEELSA